jgi:hypothetical protein
MVHFHPSVPILLLHKGQDCPGDIGRAHVYRFYPAAFANLRLAVCVLAAMQALVNALFRGTLLLIARVATKIFVAIIVATGAKHHIFTPEVRFVNACHALFQLCTQFLADGTACVVDA